MPQHSLKVSTEQTGASYVSTRGDVNQASRSTQPTDDSRSNTNGHGRAPSGMKAERSPTSPRNFKAFFKGSGRPERIERSSTPRRDGSSSSNLPSTAELSRPSAAYLYGAGSNNSTPSMSQGGTFDETASMNSVVSGVPASVRSDDEVNRLKAGSPANLGEHVAQRKGSKSSFPSNMLQRSHSKRQHDSQDAAQRLRLEQPVDSRGSDPDRPSSNPRTAPLGRYDRAIREAMQTQPARNHSADRSTAVESEDEALPPQQKASQTNFFNHFRQHGAKAADGIGRAGKGFFGKLKEGRSGSANERENGGPLRPNPTGPFLILLEPLKEQTRRTRIKKTMDEAKDKTEFWMPALPYRCIDYLNHHGIESVGLYRIPGSVGEIRQFQHKFNSPPYYDVDMLVPENEPQDINVVASLLKAWVRDLPEQLLPKSIQDKIEREAPDANVTPQVMRDELSKLSPYNYYLLFAITCHMSLLHAHRKVNKMKFGALRTCWASLDVSAYIFQFLICDWRNCWQGCFTEQDQIVVESEIIAGNRPASPTPQDSLRLLPSQFHAMSLLEPAASNNVAMQRFANTRSPERPERPARADLTERAGRSTPPVPPTSSSGQVEEPQPFAQDRPFVSRRPSTPKSATPEPSAPAHGPIQQMSPIRM
ncbi:MAG: hypothetical protein Q9162_002234 [Coniocarpon cinnabarinum]